MRRIRDWGFAPIAAGLVAAFAGLTIWTATAVAQEATAKASTPTLTEVQRLQLTTAVQAAQMAAQQAAPDALAKAITDLISQRQQAAQQAAQQASRVYQALAVEGYTLDIQTMAYTPKGGGS